MKRGTPRDNDGDGSSKTRSRPRPARWPPSAPRRARGERLRHRASRGDLRARTRRSADLPLLPRLLGRPELRRPSPGGRRRAARLHRKNRRQRLLRRLRARARASSAAAAACCRCRSRRVVYRLHSNAPLGPQRNIVVRGVPATVYDEGRSIEIYTGRVAIDVFSNSFARALAAAERLRADQRARLGRRPPARARVLPGAVRADARRGRARDAHAAPPRLSAERRRGRLRGSALHLTGAGSSR